MQYGQQRFVKKNLSVKSAHKKDHFSGWSLSKTIHQDIDFVEASKIFEVWRS